MFLGEVTIFLSFFYGFLIFPMVFLWFSYGFPTSQEAAKKAVGIIGPATVGGMMPGRFRIGNAGGAVETPGLAHPQGALDVQTWVYLTIRNGDLTSKNGD